LSKYNQIMDKPQEKEVVRDIVRNAREATGMNQRDFATAIGVTQYLIYRWESGASCPGSAMLVRISRFLNTPIVIE
jgi:ribosome-binding protein aMBF1 (putative translation factor)